VIRIELPLAPLRGPKTVNVYLLPGPPLTLVDTGPRTERAWEALEAGLAAHGYRIAGLDQLILTHAHADHYGLAARIAAASDRDIRSLADFGCLTDRSYAVDTEAP